MASLAVLKSNLSLFKMLNTVCRQCAAELAAGKQQGLPIHYELEWPALFLFLFTFLTGDVASEMK
jgi:hypothetical protein